MSTPIETIRIQIRSLDGQINSLSHQKEILLKTEQELAATSPGAITNFRDAILHALRKGTGMTGKEILQEMRASGSMQSYSGKTRPSVRLHNELFSLRKQKIVSRKDNRYFLSDKKTPSGYGIPARDSALQ